MVVDLQELARRMQADYDARTPSQRFAEPLDLTTAQAYSLQAEIAYLRERRGEKVIGCTTPPMPQQLGIGQPIFARIFNSGYCPCGTQLAYGIYANLAVKGKLAVRLGIEKPFGEKEPATLNQRIAGLRRRNIARSPYSSS